MDGGEVDRQEANDEGIKERRKDGRIEGEEGRGRWTLRR